MPIGQRQQEPAMRAETPTEVLYHMELACPGSDDLLRAPHYAEWNVYYWADRAPYFDIDCGVCDG